MNTNDILESIIGEEEQTPMDPEEEKILIRKVLPIVTETVLTVLAAAVV